MLFQIVRKLKIVSDLQSRAFLFQVPPILPVCFIRVIPFFFRPVRISVNHSVVRSTFVIDENGMIEKVMPKVKPDTNAAEILDYLIYCIALENMDSIRRSWEGMQIFGWICFPARGRNFQKPDTNAAEILDYLRKNG